MMYSSIKIPERKTNERTRVDPEGTVTIKAQRVYNFDSGRTDTEISQKKQPIPSLSQIKLKDHTIKETMGLGLDDNTSFAETL